MRNLMAVILAGLLLAGCANMEQEVQRRVEGTVQAIALQLTQGTAPDAPSLQFTRTLAPTRKASSTPLAVSANATETGSLEETPSPSPTQSRTPTPAQTATLAPDAWMHMPVLPERISEKMRAIYELGLTMGNNPQAFSTVGDCQSMLPNFLGDFDTGRYNLGEDYVSLQPTIDYFAGSFDRYSRATKDGMSAGGALATLWNTWKECYEYETPLDCEYRLQKPSFAIISLGTNDAYGFASLDVTLRRVIDITLGNGIVPVLATKADNAEGDNRNNAIIARLAYEYEIPLWNFWLAVQPLAQHGLRSKEHLTFGEFTSPFDFSNPENLQYAWNVRNLTALQLLDMLRQWASQQP